MQAVPLPRIAILECTLAVQARVHDLSQPTVPGFSDPSSAAMPSVAGADQFFGTGDSPSAGAVGQPSESVGLSAGESRESAPWDSTTMAWDADEVVWDSDRAPWDDQAFQEPGLLEDSQQQASIKASSAPNGHAAAVPALNPHTVRINPRTVGATPQTIHVKRVWAGPHGRYGLSKAASACQIGSTVVVKGRITKEAKSCDWRMDSPDICAVQSTDATADMQAVYAARKPIAAATFPKIVSRALAALEQVRVRSVRMLCTVLSHSHIPSLLAERVCVSADIVVVLGKTYHHQCGV